MTGDEIIDAIHTALLDPECPPQSDPRGVAEHIARALGHDACTICGRTEGHEMSCRWG